MPPIDLPYLWHAKNRRGGRSYWYFRQGKTLTRLPGTPGEPAFMAAYQQCRESLTPKRPAHPPGSLAALIATYRAAPEFRDLKPSTRQDYEKALRPLEERFGPLPVATMPRAFVLKLRDEYATKDGEPTPRRANRMVAVLRILLSFAVDRGIRRDNPALRPRLLRTGDGYRPWTADELAQFLAGAPVPLRLAALLAVGTGQRSIDLVAMRWASYRDGAIEVRQAKTGARVWVPCHAALREELDRTPRRALTILTTEAGKPWGLSYFQHAASRAIREAGLTGVVWHGLRHTAATWLAEAGCTSDEIRAITGHTTLASVQRYTRHADQKGRATAAIQKLDAARRSRSEKQEPEW